MGDTFVDFLDPTPALDLLKSQGVLFLVLGLVILFAAKHAYALLSRFNLNEQLTTVDNKAVAVSFGGFMMGVGIILAGVLTSGGMGGAKENQLLHDVLSTLFWGTGGIVLLLVSRFLNDKLLLYKFNNTKEIIEDRNIGTGAVEFGSFIGSAFIIYACLFGEDTGLVSAVTSAIVFFLMGQLAFMVFGLIYQKIVRYDLHGEIEKDNVAAGVSYGLNLAAVGLMLSGFIKHSDSAVGFVIWAVFSAIMLLSSRYLVDKLILPGSLLDDEVSRDRNWGAALVEGGAAIILAFISVSAFF